RDRFTTLLWIQAGEPLPELSGLAPAPLTAYFRSHRDHYRGKRGTQLSEVFAVQRLNEPTAPTVWAEISGGAEDLLYRGRRGLNASENLAYMRSSTSGEAAFKDALYATTLSGQVGRDRKD